MTAIDTYKTTVTNIPNVLSCKDFQYSIVNIKSSHYNCTPPKACLLVVFTVSISYVYLKKKEL